MPEILNTVPHHTFKTSERQCRVNLEAVIYNLPQDKYDLLVGASVAKRCCLNSAIASSVVHTNPFIADGDSLPDDNCYDKDLHDRFLFISRVLILESLRLTLIR